MKYSRLAFCVLATCGIACSSNGSQDPEGSDPQRGQNAGQIADSNNCAEIADPGHLSDSTGILCGQTDTNAFFPVGNCGQGRFCAINQCGTARYGVCETKPSSCPDIERPVCTCNNVTMKNVCWANYYGMGVRHQGACRGDDFRRGALGDTSSCGYDEGARCNDSDKWDSAACDRCWYLEDNKAKACAPLVNACDDDPQCSAFLDCIDADGCDDACEKQCANTYGWKDADPSALKKYFNKLGCLDSKCYDACYCSTLEAGDGCTPCLTTTCADEALACDRDTECNSVVQCQWLCGSNNPTCDQRCLSFFPNEIYDKLDKCANEKCGGKWCW